MWIVSAIPSFADMAHGVVLDIVTKRYGRRDVTLYEFAELCASWREAIAYATGGTPPRPLSEVERYRQWCGYDR